MFVREAYKPSSVIGGHLSRPIVTGGFKRNPESIDGPSQTLFRFLLRVGFTSRTSRQAAGELLPHLSTLTHARRHMRYLSVALSLGSPPPGVTRHPALCSSDFPHTFRRAAARQPHKRRNYSTLKCFCQRRGTMGIASPYPCPGTLSPDPFFRFAAVSS